MKSFVGGAFFGGLATVLGFAAVVENSARYKAVLFLPENNQDDGELLELNMGTINYQKLPERSNVYYVNSEGEVALKEIGLGREEAVETYRLQQRLWDSECGPITRRFWQFLRKKIDTNK